MQRNPSAPCHQRVNGTNLTPFSAPESWLPEFDVTTSGLGRPLQAGDQLALSQSLCTNVSGLSTNLPPTLSGCDGLPAPSLQTPLAGYDYVTVSKAVPGARIHVFDASGMELGDGSGSFINLRRSIVCGDIITAVQQVGLCTSANGFRITVGP